MLVHEKQSNLEKEMYGNISLYSQYFSPGAGSNVCKTFHQGQEVMFGKHTFTF